MLLSTARDVVRCLVTYVDWWQPSTASTLHIVAVRRRREGADGYRPDGFRAGLLENLDERTELQWRMRSLSDRDRELLFLWYVAQLPVDDIATAIGISRRQCFRRKAAAIKVLVDTGEADGAGWDEPALGAAAS
jgi:DNA-directed RNA polymerase specialized sigma24 family protein